MNYKQVSEVYQKQLRITDSDSSLEYELNSLLAEEYQAWYQYWSVFMFLKGEERPSIQSAFDEYGNDELNDHAKKLMNRLSELSMPCYLSTPESWKEYAQSSFVADQLSMSIEGCLTANLNSEQDAIDHYSRVIALAESQGDYTTAELLKGILADEEEHKAGLQDFINDLNV